MLWWLKLLQLLLSLLAITVAYAELWIGTHVRVAAAGGILDVMDVVRQGL